MSMYQQAVDKGYSDEQIAEYFKSKVDKAVSSVGEDKTREYLINQVGVPEAKLGFFIKEAKKPEGGMFDLSFSFEKQPELVTPEDVTATKTPEMMTREEALPLQAKVSKTIAQAEVRKSSLSDFITGDFNSNRQAAMKEAGDELVANGQIDSYGVNQKGEPVFYKNDSRGIPMEYPFESSFVDAMAASKGEIIAGSVAAIATRNPFLTALAAGAGRMWDVRAAGEKDLNNTLVKGGQAALEDYLGGKIVQVVGRALFKTGADKPLEKEILSSTEDLMKAFDVIQKAKELGIQLFKSDVTDDKAVKQFLQEAEKNIVTAGPLSEIQVKNKEALFKAVRQFIGPNETEATLQGVINTLKDKDNLMAIASKNAYKKVEDLASTYADKLGVNYRDISYDLGNLEFNIVSDRGTSRLTKELGALQKQDDLAQLNFTALYNRSKALRADARTALDKTEARDFEMMADVMEDYMDRVAPKELKDALSEAKAIVRNRYKTFGYGDRVKDADVEAVAKTLNASDVSEVRKSIKTQRDAIALKAQIDTYQSNALAKTYVEDALDKALVKGNADASSLGVSIPALADNLNKIDMKVIEALASPEVANQIKLFREIANILKPHQLALENTNILGASGVKQQLFKSLFNLQFGDAAKLIGSIVGQRTFTKQLALHSDLSKVQAKIIASLKPKPETEEATKALVTQLNAWRGGSSATVKANPGEFMSELSKYRPTYSGTAYRGVSQEELDSLVKNNMYVSSKPSSFSKDIDVAAEKGAIILKVPKFNSYKYDLNRLLDVDKYGESEIIVPTSKFQILPSNQKYKGRKVYILKETD